MFIIRMTKTITEDGRKMYYQYHEKYEIYLGKNRSVSEHPNRVEGFNRKGDATRCITRYKKEDAEDKRILGDRGYSIAYEIVELS